ncbi:ABC transporter ATP-binding protein [Streptomonospora nanhaiensis]|uniref:Fluoroquinolone transport system ATP-binding protein n=1 Tax=Streptomonospora nanhaiensis TaxID=1323731 RepID=A0A853BLX4_9ACTN|nr:ABC transporter ATP-binding protein [Streptomonospora nanhaiensis]MBV2363354.1 ABC transporter ATP-binding protein [Streptomonospora nanhaiensis]MBX9388506.1 ABC transporter ATP-binding protein [Streptomonospora nanhaiensis]NYI95715.1 fluoroquinolone transport system ATP-binding protein [Streptomonospora nanhaiensis]
MAQTRAGADRIPAASGKTPPVIEVADLTYTYPKAPVPAVRGMAFSVAPGEVFGFLGPSGAGKSTTQKILTGLLTGAQGTATVWGRPPAEWGNDYYRRIGVSFELPNHYQKLTALENLEFFASLYGGAVEDPLALLRRVGLADAAHTRVGRFSKGMQTRLTFVRALLHRPELVFLDEPTSGMDPANARIVKTMITELREQGRTVFLTTHSMEAAEELCDRVAFVVDGRIAALDSPEELRLARSRRTVRVAYRSADGRLETAEFPLDGMADDPALLALLREHRIESVHSQEAGLDDVFVEVTGRSIR